MCPRARARSLSLSLSFTHTHTYTHCRSHTLTSIITSTGTSPRPFASYILAEELELPDHDAETTESIETIVPECAAPDIRDASEFESESHLEHAQLADSTHIREGKPAWCYILKEEYSQRRIFSKKDFANKKSLKSTLHSECFIAIVIGQG